MTLRRASLTIMPYKDIAPTDIKWSTFLGVRTLIPQTEAYAPNRFPDVTKAVIAVSARPVSRDLGLYQQVVPGRLIFSIDRNPYGNSTAEAVAHSGLVRSTVDTVLVFDSPHHHRNASARRVALARNFARQHQGMLCLDVRLQKELGSTTSEAHCSELMLDIENDAMVSKSKRGSSFTGSFEFSIGLLDRFDG